MALRYDNVVITMWIFIGDQPFLDEMLREEARNAGKSYQDKWAVFSV